MKVSGVEVGEGPVEREDDRLVDTELLEEGELVGKARQPEMRLVGEKELARVGLEE